MFQDRLLLRKQETMQNNKSNVLFGFHLFDSVFQMTKAILRAYFSSEKPQPNYYRIKDTKKGRRKPTFVPRAGVEPARLSASVFETDLSTDSNIWAFFE